MNEIKKAALFVYSDGGCITAEKLRGLMDGVACDIHTTEKFAEKYGYIPHKSVCRAMGELFSSYDALIFICACGIAVRAVAPHLKNKAVDPAVIVIDDSGRYVIPILSGHIGGANSFAVKLAGLMGAEAVVTTATDIHGRFSVDEWAARHGFYITSLKYAKDIAAAILERDVAFSAEVKLPEKLPNGITAADSGDIGIVVGVHKTEHYDKTLRLVPKAVTVGIGCRKGMPEEGISSAVSEILEKYGVDLHSVYRIASIDVKQNEEGILKFASKIGAECVLYSAEELNGAKGDFIESEFVRNTVGVGNVCERAAALSGRIIIKKEACRGVTVAASVSDWGIEF